MERRGRGELMRAGVAIVLLVLVSKIQAAEHVVKPGETVWAVARAHQSAYPQANLHQIVQALLAANPEAFPKGPGKLEKGTLLQLPSSEAVAGIPPATATARVPKPTKSAAAAPIIAGVELQPAMGKEVRQWLAVTGSGFMPGAKLELFDIAKKRAIPPRGPAKTSENRLEYQARFRASPSRWRVTVRNPDGQKSAAFEFEAGKNVTVVLAPNVPSRVPSPVPSVAAASALPTGAFRESVEAKSLPAEPEQRYQQLAGMEERFAGDVDYDYGIGSAAVDTGKFTEAVFPLQRAVATQPDFAGARLELARAYYGVGDNESARREFTSLRDEKPPPRVEEMIQQYMDAIDRRAVEYQQQQSAYAEFSGGHDSNANGATDSQVFLGFNLNDRSRATASPYYGLNLGGLFSYPIAPGWRTQADAQISSRQVPDASFVNSDQARAGAALEWRNGVVTVNGTGSYAYAELDGAENNTNIALDVAASILLSEHWQLGLGARRAALRFVDALSVQDTDATLLSLALSTSRGRFQWAGGLTGGKDDAVNPASEFSRTLFGARLSAFMDTGNSRYLFASLAGLQSDYDKPYLGTFERNDTQYSAQAGLDWRDFPARLWGVKTQLTYVDNRSDIVIFDYNRFDISLALRREFR